MPADLTEQLFAFARTHLYLTGPILFALGFAESIALVSLFVPSSILFVGLGGLIGAGGGAFWEASLAGAAGSFLGDTASYALGRTYKDNIACIWPFSRYPDWLPRAEAFFERWGFLSLVFGKFLGFLRPFVPVVAGTSRMPWMPFLVGSALSSWLWAAAFLAPGFGLVLFAK